MNLVPVFQTSILISAVLVVLLILLQQRGASLGAGLGGSGELFTTRRGLDKSLFNTTIVFVVIFVLSILGLLLIPS
ncbi:preprotein translocase subunit SecG [Candidatus Saccharibacteria bacterium]|nr:preprotein translocase subunit SecG [Candidatus Saccharibacteria bacterium]MBQ3430653.1 preprotein translocase subunit SecG [Candidatus Saccharibacteria bacterium]